MSKVTVLMSTYNGERYLEEQLQSLLNQTGVDVKIFVRDDGSTDSTLRILNEYKEKDIIQLIQGKNVGWRKSFMELVYNAPDSDYYAFCDQDDIWMPEKLAVAVNALNNLQTDKPNLYCSNLYYYANNTKGRLLRSEIPYYNRYTCLLSNIAIGCTIVFNKALKDVMKNNPLEIPVAHDYWAYQTAMYLGHVIYDNNSYILYRQHDKNQIGVTKNIYEKNLKRLKGYIHYNGNHERVDLANQLLICYGQYLSNDLMQIISKIANYRTHVKSKFQILLSPKYKMNKNTFSNIAVKVRLLLNMV